MEGRKKVSCYVFCSFPSNRLELFQSEILPTYLVILYAYNSLISILGFSVLRYLHYSDAKPFWRV